MKLGVDIETQDDQIWCTGIANSEFRSAKRGATLPADIIPICHNAGFDLEYLEQRGVSFDDWRDTILEAHLLGYKPLKLEALAPIFLGVQLDKAFVKERKIVRYEDRPQEVLENCSLDAWASYALNELFEPKIQKWAGLYEKERRLTTVLRATKRRGMPLSPDKVNAARRDVITAMGRLEKQLASFGIDLGDMDAIAEQFWRGKKTIKTTKTGRLSTAADHLREYATASQKPWVNALIEYKQMDNLLNTYLKNWANQEWLYPSLNQTGTATWRFSCSSPNLQNVTKSKVVPLYHLFVAPEGYTFISADYSQIELRMLANMTQDPAMIAAYEAGRDLHDETVRRLGALGVWERYGVQDYDEQRRYSKTVNFGISYGITAYGLAPRLGMSPEHAQSFITGFYDAYPTVRPWQQEQILFAEEHGYVETFTGRPLYVPCMGAERGSLRGHGEKQCMNYPIQGGAMEIVKDAMLRCPQHLVMQVHDELLYLVPENEADEYKQYLETQLIDTRHRIPYTVDIKVGKTWGEIKNLDDIWQEEDSP